MSVTDEIKARLDIVNFIQESVPLKKAGRTYKGLCPFHSEKTPSFIVFPESQTWHCFGACGEGGDIFTFLMKRENLDFGNALAELAERAGVELEPPSPQAAAAQESGERLRKILAAAADYFQDALLNAQQAAHARAYVERRGLTPETIRRFGLGYALDSWDTTRQTLLSEGHELEDLVAAGLLVEKDDGGTYDRFRDRLMIPIRDVRGRIIGFGARALKPDAVPKYLNSPQSPIFDKSRNLFGLSEARRAIREQETVVIVEGYMDVLQAHQAGFDDVVAQMGTSLTEAQLKTLRRYASRFILALDADTAGTKATLRGLDTARAALDQQLQPTFNARGMVTYEGHLDAEIRVLLLPEGMDPDDVIRESPDQWAALIDDAVPVTEFAIHAATQDRDLDDPKVKKQIVQELGPLIDDIADATEREHYRQRLARLLKVNERVLMVSSAATAVRARVRSRARRDEAPEEASAQEAWFEAQTTAPPREAFCLASLIRLPDLLYKADRLLKQHDLEEVSPQDFSHVEHQIIFGTWQRALGQIEREPLDYLRDTLDEALTARLDALLEEYAHRQHNQDKARLSGDGLRSVLELRHRRLATDMQNLRFLIQEAHENGDLTAKSYWETITVYEAARLRLDKMIAAAR